MNRRAWLGLSSAAALGTLSGGATVQTPRGSGATIWLDGEEWYRDGAEFIRIVDREESLIRPVRTVPFRQFYHRLSEDKK